MTYEEWAATVGRGVTINPQMAFAAGAASRDAEIAELVPAEFAMLILRARAAIAKVRKP